MATFDDITETFRARSKRRSSILKRPDDLRDEETKDINPKRKKRVSFAETFQIKPFEAKGTETIWDVTQEFETKNASEEENKSLLNKSLYHDPDENAYPDCTIYPDDSLLMSESIYPRGQMKESTFHNIQAAPVSPGKKDSPGFDRLIALYSKPEAPTVPPAKDEEQRNSENIFALYAQQKEESPPKPSPNLHNKTRDMNKTIIGSETMNLDTTLFPFLRANHNLNREKDDDSQEMEVAPDSPSPSPQSGVLQSQNKTIIACETMNLDTTLFTFLRAKTRSIKEVDTSFSSKETVSTQRVLPEKSSQKEMAGKSVIESAEAPLPTYNLRNTTGIEAAQQLPEDLHRDQVNCTRLGEKSVNFFHQTMELTLMPAHLEDAPLSLEDPMEVTLGPTESGDQAVEERDSAASSHQVIPDLSQKAEGLSDQMSNSVEEEKMKNPSEKSSDCLQASGPNTDEELGDGFLKLVEADLSALAEKYLANDNTFQIALNKSSRKSSGIKDLTLSPNGTSDSDEIDLVTGENIEMSVAEEPPARPSRKSSVGGGLTAKDISLMSLAERPSRMGPQVAREVSTAEPMDQSNQYSNKAEQSVITTGEHMNNSQLSDGEAMCVDHQNEPIETSLNTFGKTFTQDEAAPCALQGSDANEKLHQTSLASSHKEDAAKYRTPQQEKLISLKTSQSVTIRKKKIVEYSIISPDEEVPRACVAKKIDLGTPVITQEESFCNIMDQNSLDSTIDISQTELPHHSAKDHSTTQRSLAQTSQFGNSTFHTSPKSCDKDLSPRVSEVLSNKALCQGTPPSPNSSAHHLKAPPPPSEKLADKPDDAEEITQPSLNLHKSSSYANGKAASLCGFLNLDLDESSILEDRSLEKRLSPLEQEKFLFGPLADLASEDKDWDILHVEGSEGIFEYLWRALGLLVRYEEPRGDGPVLLRQLKLRPLTHEDCPPIHHLATDLIIANLPSVPYLLARFPDSSHLYQLLCEVEKVTRRARLLVEDVYAIKDDRIVHCEPPKVVVECSSKDSFFTLEFTIDIATYPNSPCHPLYQHSLGTQLCPEKILHLATLEPPGAELYLHRIVERIMANLPALML